MQQWNFRNAYSCVAFSVRVVLTKNFVWKLKTVKYIYISRRREMWMYSPKTLYLMHHFGACGTHTGCRACAEHFGVLLVQSEDVLTLKSLIGKKKWWVFWKPKVKITSLSDDKTTRIFQLPHRPLVSLFSRARLGGRPHRSTLTFEGGVGPPARVLSQKST